MEKPTPQVVMFSGGRDSTLVACHLMLQGIPVFLFTGNSGCSLHRAPFQLRLEELRKRFGDLVVGHAVEDISGTFRAIALVNIETDILKHKKNLVLLGEKLALHVHAVDFCKRRGMTVVNDGVVAYEKEFPEQRPGAMAFLCDFMKNYGIEYRSPLYRASSMLEVKNRLLQLGLSPKSIEGVTIFGNTFSTPSDEVILEYLHDKEPLARDIVAFLMGGLDEKQPHLPGKLYSFGSALPDLVPCARAALASRGEEEP